MNPTVKGIYNDRVAAVQAGAFRHLEVDPVIPREGSVPSERRQSGCGNPRHRVSEPWRDKERGYAPGELTTREWIEAVIEVLIEAPNAKMGQTPLNEAVAERFSAEKTRSGMGRVSGRVSASLYWLRVVGAVHECEKKRVVVDGVAKGRPTVHWQLVEIPAVYQVR